MKWKKLHETFEKLPEKLKHRNENNIKENILWTIPRQKFLNII